MIDSRKAFEPIEWYPDILNNFLTYLSVNRKRSINTCEKYGENIYHFLRYIANKKGFKLTKRLSTNTIKQITLNDIDDFIAYCSTELNNSEATINSKISALDAFYKHLIRQKIVDNNLIQNVERPKLQQNKIEYLTHEEVVNFLDTIKNSNEQYKIRDYCIFTILFSTGIRLSGLIGIDIKDIDFKKEILIVNEKGNKIRKIPLNNECITAINKYLEYRSSISDNIKDKEALFISRNGNRIDNTTIQKMIKKYAKLAGLNEEKMHIHLTRHTCATLMLANGVDIRTVQEILGHENINTTTLYAHVLDENKRNAINSLKFTK